MEQRMDYITASPEAFQAVLGLEEFVSQRSGIEKGILHLLKIRASQINGCAYCIDMHMKEARKHGFGDQWLSLISVWRESPVYSDKERAVLAWTESLTNVAQTGAPDSDYELLKPHFSDEEIAKLTVAVGTINIWNRIAVGLRAQHEIDKVN
ncbi:carboxymuconolactone decarboxylase family protein [Curvivirga aplysinae]|uniref:carboxymuconolactone decarboxylase family protein n=1 Tax=Curvivirga aplysinae TaxID=2529852 RepID=UPI0012BC2246|nr:carboxymuconolactone decarboxylase family protein [Curvivirga aplysinae]MTI11289.1 carboxymuconolactone decarboxylase family protein [Curvivirga aplysinae]